MKRVCVWGTSLRKIADEAQVIAFIRILAKRFPGTEITLFSRYGDRMLEIVGSEGVRVVIPTWNLRRVAAALARSDLFILEGGPFYEELRQACVCHALVAIARRNGNQVIAYGATAFRFRTWWGRLLYRALFARMDAITVRERIGREIIDELQTGREIATFADPRFVLDPPPAAATRALLAAEGIDPDLPYICMTTRFLHRRLPRWVKRSHEYSDHCVERANAAIASAVSMLATLAPVVLLPMHPTRAEDEAMAEVLRAGMQDPGRLHLLRERYPALAILGLVDRAELLFAGRVGSAVFGTIAGTPTVAVAYEPRMTDHMDRIGCGDVSFDWRELDSDALLGALSQTWRERSEIRSRMKQSADSFRKLAWDNAEILAPSLERGM